MATALKGALRWMPTPKRILVKKTQSTAMSMSMTVTDIPCGNGDYVCNDGQTCCKMSDGHWGCCHNPNAVCCSDGVHCCPHGYKCDVTAGTCDPATSTMKKGVRSVPWLSKTPARRVPSKVADVKCDDRVSCPDSNTCCRLKSGDWGCCPSPAAVCCSDGVHCCPHGTTCDVSAGTCDGVRDHSSSELLLTLISKKKKKTLLKSVGDIVCPDGKSMCTDTETCCLLKGGYYGCCPSPKATCCNDQVHCCPNGYLCDVFDGKCVPQVRAVKMTPLVAVRKNIICPDQMSECPADQTCCKMSSGSYGCCPAPNAVCCDDEKHCCPHGTTCASGSCKSTSAAEGQEFSILKTALVRAKPATDIVCPGGDYICPTLSTCCPQPSGAWGCCPLVQAVCCSDGQHCCPPDYICDLLFERCLKPGSILQLPVRNRQGVNKSLMTALLRP